MAWFMGTVTYVFGVPLRAVGFANLDLVYGDRITRKAKARILRHSFINFARTVLDIFWFSRHPHERIKNYVDIDPSLDHVLCDAAQVCVTGHIGSWELMGHIFSVYGFPLVSVAAPLANPGAEGLFQQLREQTGQKIVPRTGAVRHLLRTLNAGGKIGILLDQNTRSREGGIHIAFFGVPATVSPVAEMLALRTKASVAFTFCVPTTGGRYRAYSPIEPIRPDPTRGVARGQLIHQITRVFEQAILDQPEAWVWCYKRWKQRAEGVDPALYPFYSKPPR
jgi:KDO2-lipid IV(A) lauroyltransferase